MSTLPHIGPTIRTQRALHRAVQAVEQAEQQASATADRELHQAIDYARHAPMFVAPEYSDPINHPRAWLWAGLIALALGACGLIAWMLCQPWRVQ